MPEYMDGIPDFAYPSIWEMGPVLPDLTEHFPQVVTNLRLLLPHDMNLANNPSRFFSLMSVPYFQAPSFYTHNNTHSGGNLPDAVTESGALPVHQTTPIAVTHDDELDSVQAETATSSGSWSLPDLSIPAAPTLPDLASYMGPGVGTACLGEDRRGRGAFTTTREGSKTTNATNNTTAETARTVDVVGNRAPRKAGRRMQKLPVTVATEQAQA